ncbi:hypothetical protein BHM03_00010027 [Ensete ventricosum]|nr:hypothetical protein BHM03_00010027 [Ensete ventricosum]
MVNLAHLRSEGATVTCVADPHPPSLEHALDLARSLHAPPPAVILLLLSCLPLCAGKGRVLHSCYPEYLRFDDDFVPVQLNCYSGLYRNLFRTKLLWSLIHL